jgi:hypothetical protein
MKIKTASDLKYAHENAHPSSLYFNRRSMKFFGDTMANYGIRQPVTVVTSDGQLKQAYELYRKRAVKCGLRSSVWFDSTTFERLHIQ